VHPTEGDVDVAHLDQRRALSDRQGKPSSAFRIRAGG
jgi:hypothetical protein